jgi:hypothetical protein
MLERIRIRLEKILLPEAKINPTTYAKYLTTSETRKSNSGKENCCL